MDRYVNTDPNLTALKFASFLLEILQESGWFASFNFNPSASKRWGSKSPLFWCPASPAPQKSDSGYGSKKYLDIPV